jgi:hypothetical protein
VRITTVAPPKGPIIAFTLEEDGGDVDIMANGSLIAYFHINDEPKVYLQLISGIETEVVEAGMAMDGASIRVKRP